MHKLLICLLLMSIATFTDMKGQVPFQDSSYTWTEAGFIAPGDVITMKYKFDAEPIFINGLFYFDILFTGRKNSIHSSKGIKRSEKLKARYRNS